MTAVLGLAGRVVVALLAAVGTQLIVYVLAASLLGDGWVTGVLSLAGLAAGARAGWVTELPPAAPLTEWGGAPHAIDSSVCPANEK